MDAIQLDTLVTVVDCSTFYEAYMDKRAVAERPDFVAQPGDPTPVVMARFDGSLHRAVVDLLVEQVECADVVLLNKADLVDAARLEALKDIIKALNPDARVIATEHGATSLTSVLGITKGLGVAAAGPVDEHKAAVAAVKAANCDVADCTDPTHAHSKEKSTEEDCAEPACTDPSHDHSHSAHGHSHASTDLACEDVACTDPSHDHSHSENAACAEPACTDPTHDHSHSENSENAACAEPACTDPTHDHSHSSHSHAKVSTAQERFGIESFVYSRRRPLDPTRLEKVLAAMPADASASLGTATTTAAAAATGDELKGALRNVLRSKGFMWVASSHDVAYYWSHAGAHFTSQILGRWWDTVPRDRWPEDQVDVILSDFDGDDGDRRNEIVFIGPSILAHQKTIQAALDAALLSDAELEKYRATKEADRALVFPSNVAKKP